MRIEWSIHQRFAGTNAIAFLHVDVRTARDVVLALFTVVAGNDQFAFAFGDRAERDRTVDFRHDRRFRRPSSFKELDDARQTAGDVLGLGSFARDLRDDVAGSTSSPSVTIRFARTGIW